MTASIKSNCRKSASNQQFTDSEQPHMVFEAIAALILDYVAVAAVIGLFLLERSFGIRLGRTLDIVLLLVIVAAVALSVVAWVAGASLAHLDSGHATTTRRS